MRADAFYSNRPIVWHDADDFNCFVRSHLRKMVPADSLVADLGCGEGRISEVLVKDCKVVGYDINKNGLKMAKCKGLKVINCHVDKILPIRSNTFDVVVSNQVIEHLFDTDTHLAEAFRILKPDGLLFLTTPNLADVVSRVRLLFGLLPINCEVSTRFKTGFERPVGHIHSYTATELRKHLELSGFRIVSLTGYSGIFGWLRVLPSLCGQLVIVARKV